MVARIDLSGTDSTVTEIFLTDHGEFSIFDKGKQSIIIL